MKTKKGKKQRPHGPERVVATLVIRKPGAMTQKGRADVSRWLIDQAMQLAAEGHQYSETRFVGKYIVR